MKYTYRWPGGPNIAAFRGVMPRNAWLAGSSGPYASTSTIRAARAAKCATVDGLQMLAAQAVRQAQLFGVRDVTLGEILEILDAGRAP